MSRAALTLAALLLGAVPAAANDVAEPSPVAAATDFAAVNSMVVQAVALPAWAGFANRTAELVPRIEAACADPAMRPAAVAAWGEAMAAWQRAQMVQAGPAFEGDTISRLAFWPDKHGTAGRQVAQALQAEDAGLLDPAVLAGRSVGLQGLPAIERLLGETGPHAGYACKLAATAATVMAGRVAATASAWAGFADSVLAAAEPDRDDAGTFFGAYDPAALFLKGTGQALGLVAQQKLRGPLGADLAGARPKQAESWRSEQSLAWVALNLATAERMLCGRDGFADLAAAAGGDGPVAGAAVCAAMAAATADLRQIEGPLEGAITDPAQRPRVEALATNVEAVARLVTTKLAPSVGITLGVNALDGD